MSAIATLSGTVADFTTLLWTQVSGDEAVISDPTEPVTDVELPGVGVYRFRLTATNSCGSESDDVLVYVNAPGDPVEFSWTLSQSILGVIEELDSGDSTTADSGNIETHQEVENPEEGENFPSMRVFYTFSFNNPNPVPVMVYIRAYVTAQAEFAGDGVGYLGGFTQLGFFTTSLQTLASANFYAETEYSINLTSGSLPVTASEVVLEYSAPPGASVAFLRTSSNAAPPDVPTPPLPAIITLDVNQRIAFEYLGTTAP